MLELEQAVEKILGSMPDPKGESIPLEQAYGRVVLEPVAAVVDLPAFDNSSVDGYAVRASEVAQASAENPVWLKLAGKVAAGESFSGQLAAGQCIRIFTGSPLPAAADAVVMQEDTRLDVARSQEVSFLDSARPWENVRFRGEDVKRGTTVARRGEILGAAQLGVLAATGSMQVHAGRRPSVALIATGSELQEPGTAAALASGQIYESNRAALAPLIKSAGGIPNVFPIVPDDPKSTRDALARALSGNDLVVTCGGVSVGEMDFVKSAFEEMGGNLEFWKVAIKPGRPFVFGRKEDKFLFGLPGNPVSAFVTFLLLVRPAILRWQGAEPAGLPASAGILAEPIVNQGNRRHFLRVTLDAKGEVRSSGAQASHFLGSLANSQGLLDVPPATTLAAGKTVEVLRWE